jgi:hypothetical protein
METINLNQELFRIGATDEFKWMMFTWYMQGFHEFNYWTLKERV